MNTKEIWIEETLNSLNNIERQNVPLHLNFALQNNSKSKEIKLTTAQKWWVAASAILLVGINYIAISQYSKSVKNYASSNEKNIIYQEYFSND